MSNPTADWERVGDKFYRKTQLYTSVFDQDLELENYIVVGCAYGGAVGTLQYIRDTTHFRYHHIPYKLKLWSSYLMLAQP